MNTIDISLSSPSRSSMLRVLGQVFLKDWKQYWRYPLNAVSSILQFLIWLAPVYFMSQAFSTNGRAEGFAGYSGSSDYISFIIVGSALGNFIMAVFWGMGFSLKEDMDAGVLESTWLCPVPRPLLLVGRTLSSLTITAIDSIGSVAIASLFFGFRPTGNALLALLNVIPLLIGLYGFGFAFAALVMIVREANTMVDMGSFFVQLFSGASFPIQALPAWMVPISMALPLTYGFDAVRGWLLGTRTILPLAWEAGILIAFMFVMGFLGLRAFYALEKRVRIKGTLGQY
jgi:ABC-2 type transport system permease protein